MRNDLDYMHAQEISMPLRATGERPISGTMPPFHDANDIVYQSRNAHEIDKPMGAYSCRTRHHRFGDIPLSRHLARKDEVKNAQCKEIMSWPMMLLFPAKYHHLRLQNHTIENARRMPCWQTLAIITTFVAYDVA